MLRRSTVARGGSGGGKYHAPDLSWALPKGVPKRTFPFRQTIKHPAFAPNPGGFWISKYVISWPFVYWEINFYRLPVMVTTAAILYDLNYGIYVPFMREQVPGKSRHHWAGNAGGAPHHFWCYQDGWYVPNESGATRYVE